MRPKVKTSEILNVIGKWTYKFFFTSWHLFWPNEAFLTQMSKKCVESRKHSQESYLLIWNISLSKLQISKTVIKAIIIDVRLIVNDKGTKTMNTSKRFNRFEIFIYQLLIIPDSKYKKILTFLFSPFSL